MNTVITIGREFSSGGREFGRKLAEELGFEYYDKEIITEISQRTELSEKYVQQVIEHSPHDLLPITVGHSFAYLHSSAIEQTQAVFREQSNVIKEMAEKSNCVIVGRCADYILREINPYRFFIYADMESKIKRCRQHLDNGENLSDRQLRKIIKRIDKARARYYEFYTGLVWGDKINYDMCVNTSKMDIEKEVEEIARIFK